MAVKLDSVPWTREDLRFGVFSKESYRLAGVTLFQGRLMFLPSARPLPTDWLSDSGRWGQKEPCSYLWTLKYRMLQHRRRSLLVQFSGIITEKRRRRRKKSSLPRVFLKLVLDALTMMNIPVHYQHPVRDKIFKQFHHEKVHRTQTQSSLSSHILHRSKENTISSTQSGFLLQQRQKHRHRFIKIDKVRSDITSLHLLVSLFHKLNCNAINWRRPHQVFILSADPESDLILIFYYRQRRLNLWLIETSAVSSWIWLTVLLSSCSQLQLLRYEWKKNCENGTLTLTWRDPLQWRCIILLDFSELRVGLMFNVLSVELAVKEGSTRDRDVRQNMLEFRKDRIRSWSHLFKPILILYNMFGSAQHGSPGSIMDSFNIN